MKLTFYGAAHEVTGSCYLLEACSKRILIDCGMLQGKDRFVHDFESIDPPAVDMVLLTHAHIDHSGNLPVLYKKGYRNRILTVNATRHLCGIMLLDSAHIQEQDAEWKNKKATRAGRALSDPEYDTKDAQAVLSLFDSTEYNTLTEIFPGIKVRFIDAGHLLGSASIEIFVTEDGAEKKIVFSGDIGNLDQPLIEDPEYITEGDYVIMESTYGNRTHGERPDYVKELTQILQETFDRGGNVIIPSFAVGRTQEMLYFIRQIKEQDLVKNHERFPVYVDSPLAVEATEIYSQDTCGYYDKEALELIKNGINPLSFPNLCYSISTAESRAINDCPVPKVIISASGMCDAGRIRHHLKHNLWKEENTILFVGYQAEGTLGRILLNGVDKVKLFGEDVVVRARIMEMQGVSGHADMNGLHKWIGSFAEKPHTVFVTHGASDVCDEFAAGLKEKGFNAVAPNMGEQYDLLTMERTKEAKYISLEPAKKADAVFDRLVAAAGRLMDVVKKNIGLNNKDKDRFTKEIDNLTNKWDIKN